MLRYTNKQKKNCGTQKHNIFGFKQDAFMSIDKTQSARKRQISTHDGLMGRYKTNMMHDFKHVCIDLTLGRRTRWVDK